MIPIAVPLMGLMGLAIGSFLNVVIYRVPAGVSVVTSRSACPRCGKAIRPRDNVPVLSWILLRGRCRDCGAPISAVYPTVEILTAVAFAGIAWSAFSSLSWGSLGEGASSFLTLVAFLWLAGAGIALLIIDVRVGRLPNTIVVPLYVIGISLLAISAILSGDSAALIRAGAGLGALALGYGLLLLLVPGGMGWGDVKLSGILGFYLGWVGWGALIVGALAAFVLGGIVGLWLIATKRAQRTATIPFGPWMLAGTWLGIVAGNALWSHYVSFVDVLVDTSQTARGIL